MLRPTLRRLPGFALLLASTLSLAGAAPRLRVVPDLDQRLAQWHPVAMPFDTQALSERERQMLDKLVSASREVEQIYWLQGDPDGFALWKSLATEKRGARPSAEELLDQKVRRMLWIQGSRYDLLDEHKPFVGDEPMAPGRALYPKDLTRAEFEAYRDGTSHVVMSPLEFMQRLAALVPRPRLHLIRFHGVLAPHAKLRAPIVPIPAQTTTGHAAACDHAHGASVRMSWARLLKRVFDFDVERGVCGGKLKIIAAPSTGSGQVSKSPR